MRFDLGAALVAALAALAALGAASAEAQGLEVSLHGHLMPRYGEALTFAGTAYEVQGLAELAPLSGAEVVARLRDRQQQQWQVVAEASVRAGGDGRFTVSVDVPERSFASPQLQIEVRGKGQTRTFEHSLSLQQPFGVDVRTDRRRYEPGETVHVWTRLHRLSDGAPVRGRALRVVVADPSGRPLTDERRPASDGGVAALDVALPASAADGTYHVRVTLDDSVAQVVQTAGFTVARRTVERLLVEATVDQVVVAPSGAVTGRVSVRTPSGVPIAGATVHLTLGGQTTELRTDDAGVAPIRMQAPAYLAGDVVTEQVVARVAHPAHGVLHVSASFLLSRVEWRVEATAENGGLVPEVESEAIFAVTDPRGQPAPAGTELVVRGAVVPRGEARVRIDRHGLAVVPLRVADGAAGPLGAECPGRFATRVDVEVMTPRTAFARVCIPVSPDARVRARVRARVVEPGGELVVALDRHPEVRGRDVLVEALAFGRVIASTHAKGATATLRLPAGASGVVQIRARPELPHDARHALDVPGGSALGVGTSDAVLVRPADAFALALEPVTPQGRDVFLVQETAPVRLRPSGPTPRAWAAVVVRDLMMHGGEEPFSLAWMQGAIREAAARPDTEDAALLVRTALTAGLSPDTKPHRAPPLVTPPWSSRHEGGHQDGTLRDPVAQRDEVLRRQVGQIAIQLERIVEQRGHDAAQRRGVLAERGGRLDFDPEVFATLRRERSYTPVNLGGQPVTLAMVRAADPSFSFDAVAARIARKRLVTLLSHLSRLTNVDDPGAARASAGEPPERWLSRLVQLGVISPQALLDPWGRPFVLRPSTSPRIVFSERAPTWELVSPGADGRLGTNDDVRDPFQRVVPEGTPYAVASGEDALMKRLSTLAAGPTTLAAMMRAFASVSLAARDEQRVRTVTASASEGDDADYDGVAFAEEESINGLGLSGTGRGGGGVGQGTIGLGGALARTRASAAPAPPAEPAMAMEMAAADRAEDERQQRGPTTPSVMASLSALVREDFPATLHFVAEVPLDGATTVPVRLADALTTYRVEAIAWTESGWVTTASGELRVDQEATVDAPVPPFATVGDAVRLPLRVQNRSAAALEVRVVIEAEGVDVGLPEAIRVTVPPRDAVERTVSISARSAGSGRLVVSALRASDGQGLDAVRRPLTIYPDARLVRERREVLTEPGRGAAELRFEVPADASERGPAELRIVPATALFGELASYAEGHTVLGWGLALRGEAIPEPELARARALVRAQDPVEERDIYGNPIELGRAVSTLWRDATVDDAVIRRALRAVTHTLGEEPRSPDPGRADLYARVLLSLAPAHRTSARPAVAPIVATLVERLRTGAGSGAVEISDQPVLHARVAAALALTGGGERARELLRRASRAVVRFESEAGEQAFLEEPSSAGQIAARVEPTALVALAYAGVGEAPRGLPFLRALVAIAGEAERWPLEGRAFATAAAATLAGGTVDARVRASFDGQALTLRAPEEGSAIRVATIEGAGRAGRHVIRLEDAGAFALAFVDLRYGRPWDAPPARTIGAQLDVEGPTGPRDARAGLVLVVRSREARVLGRPVVEIDLPAGTELDEPTRDALRGAARGQATVEGRTLRLPLRPIAPGGFVRIPLPLRWSVGGTLRGLGVSLYDEAQPVGDAARATAVLPSRALTIPDEGDEPEARDGSASPPPTPPPPPPPPPLPPIERFGPVASAGVVSTEEARS
ncbi:MAG: hypothetical protein KF901_09425 [Myxococcales bacterium]|nr:hypothetical protein [Myxococcales bacterium]